MQERPRARYHHPLQIKMKKTAMDQDQRTKSQFRCAKKWQEWLSILVLCKGSHTKSLNSLDKNGQSLTK